MESHKKLLLANKAWVQEKLKVRENFFSQQTEDQKPDFMWIGCSDSRVPAEDVTGTEPGDLFVHRNIANLVLHTDLNLISGLQYAVEVLRVNHVIVCGHYRCDGIRNAMGSQDLGLINNWLWHIKDVYRLHARTMEPLADEQARWDRLVELNVSEQIQHLAETSIIQKSWRSARRPHLHGWVYDPRSGLLKEMATLAPGSRIDDIYALDFDE